MSSPDGYTISGLIFGLLGLAAVGQLFWQWISVYLPTDRLKLLDETLEDTDVLFDAVVEEGTLPEAEGFEKRIMIARDQTETLRAQVYCAITMTQQIRGLVGGLTRDLMKVCDEVDDIRSQIFELSEKEKSKMEAVAGTSLPPSKYMPPAMRKKRHTLFQVYPAFGSFNVPDKERLELVKAPRAYFPPPLR